MFPNLSKFFCLLAVILCSGAVLAQQISSVENKNLLNSPQGAVIQLPGLLGSGIHLPELDYQKVVMPGPQFVISDDPEYIRVPEGVALQENVAPGRVRLYLYNVNGVKEPGKMNRKITALIKNTGTHSLHFRMLKYSSQTPSGNYFKVGKEGMAEFYAAKPENRVRVLQPGMTMPIDEKRESEVVKFDELVHGIYEFIIDQPAEISVIQTAPKTKSEKALAAIKTVLPPKSHSGAGRGLYGIANYQINVTDTFNTMNGPGQLVVADGTRDPWITGTEKTTGLQVKDVGNYGVLYHLHMKWKSSDGKGLALVVWNSRCNAMSAAMVSSRGKFKPGIIQLPGNTLVARGAPEGILVQLFLPDKNQAVQSIHITYSPPAASCLPTPLVFIPVDLK